MASNQILSAVSFSFSLAPRNVIVALGWLAVICAVLAAVLFWTKAGRYLIGAALGFGASSFVAAFSNALSPMRFASFAGQSAYTIEWLIGTAIALVGAVGAGIAWYLLRDTEENLATGRMWFGAMIALAIGALTMSVIAFMPSVHPSAPISTNPSNVSTSWLAKGSKYATATAPVVGGPVRQGSAAEVLAGVQLDHQYVESSAPSNMGTASAVGWIQSHREWSDPFPHTDWPSVHDIIIAKANLTDLHKDVWVVAAKGITVPVRELTGVKVAHELVYVIDANTGEFIGVYAGPTSAK